MNNLKSTSNNINFQTLMNCFPSNRQNFDYLIRLIHRHVVIPFIGAGFSANFGYPSWGSFLSKQAYIYSLSEVKSAIDNLEYERAATLLENYLGGSFEYTLTQTFGDHIYKGQYNNTELDCLPKIFRNLILTTNFDEVVEMLYAKVNGEHIDKITPRSLQDITLCHKRIASGEPTLIKLHGDVASREFVLTEQTYDKVYGKRILDVRLPLPSFLRDVLLSRVILFLGCSLEDDRTLKVIEQSQIDGSISFALLELPKVTENINEPWNPKLIEQIDNAEIENPVFTKRRTFLNEHGIIPIWFPYKKYDALKIFLTELTSQTHSEYTFSVTQARSQVKDLLEEGGKLSKNNKTAQAFGCYTSVWKIVKANSEAFAETNRLNILEQIESFCIENGYAIDCKEITKEITNLIYQVYCDDSIELSMRYHRIGYAYENYQYNTFMLKAMQRSKEILQKYEEKSGKDNDFFNAAAFVYTSLAYAFLKNDDEQNAKLQYHDAEELLSNYEYCLNDKAKAFIYNGLYRYYELLCDNDKAINTLEEALRLRESIYSKEDLTDNENQNILKHIINTHSNKIHIYLKNRQYEEAENEFQICKNEHAINWNNAEYMRDSKRRILTDHGDILILKGEFESAYIEYKNALKYRKYLYFIDDYSVANIYLKVADCLKNMSERFEEAMEYAIQAYVIYEKTFGTESFETQNIRTNYIEKLCESLSYDNKAIEQRLFAQQEFFRYRHNERLDNQQDELLIFYNL